MGIHSAVRCIEPAAPYVLGSKSMHGGLAAASLGFRPDRQRVPSKEGEINPRLATVSKYKQNGDASRALRGGYA
jgi:hypothetical protein